MPFGGYPDFNSCVSGNQDKTDPEAFCAWLEHQTTGSWPGEMTKGLPDNVASVYWDAFDGVYKGKGSELPAKKAAIGAAAKQGWYEKNGKWVKLADFKIKTQDVLGFPIFAIGEHNGDEYTDKDLDDMVTAFNDLKGRVDPPVKIGHSSDEFNNLVATKMGIPPELIKGEKGNGAMAFGWVGSLRKQGNILYADLTNVPSVIADLIVTGAYKKVSAEVAFNLEDKDKKYPKVLVGLALLGSEAPAVKESGLETAAVYTEIIKANKSIEYDNSAKENAGNIIKKEANMNPQILAELGLPPEATDEQCIQKIQALKSAATQAKATPEQVAQLTKIREALGLKDDVPVEKTIESVTALKAKADEKASGDTAKFTDMEGRIANLTKDLDDQKHVNRVAHYKEVALGMPAISGKPEEKAAEWAKLEEMAGKEAVDAVIKQFKELNTGLIALGVFKAQGTPAAGSLDGEHEFTKAVRKYQEEKGADESSAFAAIKKEKPLLFKQYMRERPVVVGRADEK